LKKVRKKHFFDPDHIRKKSIHTNEYLIKKGLFEKKVIDLFNEGIEFNEIAKKISRSRKLNFSSSQTLIRKILRKHKSELNIYPSSNYISNKRNQEITADFNSGLKMKEIAVKYKLTAERVRQVLFKSGLTVKINKPKKERFTNQLKKTRNQEIINEYLQRKNHYELSDSYNLCYFSLRKIIKNNNILYRKEYNYLPKPKLNGEERLKRYLKIIEEYKNGSTIHQVAKRFSYRDITIYNILRSHNIKLRPRKSKQPE